MSLHLEGIEHCIGGKTVLRGVGFEVSAGEVLCLLGPSGCGKTTLLRLVAGLEEVQAGCIRIDGRIVASGTEHLPPERRGIGFVFQDLALFPHLTVMENVMFGLADQRDQAVRREKAIAALRRVDMEARARVFPHELSGGQQQRVALARALAPGPRIMLLDEPFSSLDARLRGQVRDQTVRVLKDSGVATVMVTHDPEEAMFMGDRIVLLREGLVVQTGTPRELYTRPATAFAAAFFSEVNTLRGTVRDGGVRTVLGRVDLPGLPDGTGVSLMFRPDAVRISAGKDAASSHAVRARVAGCHLLPGSMLLYLQMPDEGEGGKTLRIQARVPGFADISEGMDVHVEVPARFMHVFSDETGARIEARV